MVSSSELYRTHEPENLGLGQRIFKTQILSFSKCNKEPRILGVYALASLMKARTWDLARTYILSRLKLSSQSPQLRVPDGCTKGFFYSVG